MKLNAVEIISAQATAPGSSASFTAVSGDSLEIRAEARNVVLLGMWAVQQESSAGYRRVLSPRLHDNVNGIQMLTRGSLALDELRFPAVQQLHPQDILSVDGSGSSAAGDIESVSLLIGYENLLGADGKYIDADQVDSAGEELLSVRMALSLGTTGGYSGSESISNDQDSLKRNEWYAILGCWQDTNIVNSIGFTAPEWGNLRIGMPAGLDSARYGTWFYDRSRDLGVNMIPVFNASNAGRVTVDALTNENGGTPNVLVNLVRLGRLPAGGRRR